jgi:hypothetical protein
VLHLGPGIGIEKINPIDHGIGQPIENLRGVIIVNTDVGTGIGLQRRQHLCHRIDERLDANEPGPGRRAGTMQQMLATAEANFEAHLVHRPGP